VTETVAVLGPGAVGGMLAVRLARAGRRVIAVATAQTAAAIRADGVTLVAPDGIHTEAVGAVEELSEPVELLVVAVKSPALRGALDRVAVEPDLVIPLLNGIEHMEALRERFGAVVAAGSVGRFTAYRESPSRIVQTTAGALLTVSTPSVARLLGVAGVDVEVEANERVVLWRKAARLAPITAVSALSQSPLGEIRADAEWQNALEGGIEEACAVATADGAPTTPEEQWAMIDLMPPSALTSAARDVAAGRPSELDAIVGGVVRAGERLGVPTPVLADLLRRLEGK
jgi:2-dehydropantoate 2-reductase